MTLPVDPSRSRRDRAILATAVAAVLLTSSLVAFTVLKAERDGTRALERLQQSQVEQLARSMNTRVETTFVQFGKFIPPLQLSGRVGDPADKAKLKVFDDLLKSARTGFYLVDKDRHLSNGALLRSGVELGTVVDRPGLDKVLAGEAGILRVAPGLTTALPTIAYAFPLTQGQDVV